MADTSSAPSRRRRPICSAPGHLLVDGMLVDVPLVDPSPNPEGERHSRSWWPDNLDSLIGAGLVVVGILLLWLTVSRDAALGVAVIVVAVVAAAVIVAAVVLRDVGRGIIEGCRWTLGPTCLLGLVARICRIGGGCARTGSAALWAGRSPPVSQPPRG
jgi:hypothetical protein